MEEYRLGPQAVRFDRDATEAVYKGISRGGADECGCLFCRNYSMQRTNALSVELLALLEKLGIDSNKEEEVYELGLRADGSRRLYGGWFYFIGNFVEEGEKGRSPKKPGEFQFGECGPLNPLFPADKSLSVQFLSEIPWILPEKPD